MLEVNPSKFFKNPFFCTGALTPIRQKHRSITFLNWNSPHARLNSSGCYKKILNWNSPHARLNSSGCYKKILNWNSPHARLNSSVCYKKKKYKKVKAYQKSVQKQPTVKRCLLIVDLWPLRSQVKGKHSIGREFQSLAVQGKKLLTSL